MRALVRIRAKIEKNTLCGKTMIIKRAKKGEKHHFGRTLVSIRSKIEKTPFLVRLWLKEGQNRKKNCECFS